MLMDHLDIQHLMQDMLATMYKSEGIGLAAVQTGVHLRIVVMDVDYSEREIKAP